MKRFRKLSLIIFIPLLIGNLGLFLTSCNNDNPPISQTNPTIEILNGSEAELEIGKTLQLSISVRDLKSDVFYESLNPAIASVSNSGLIIALSSGSTTIKAYSNDAFDEIKITVVEPFVEISTSIEITTKGPLVLSLNEAKNISFIVENYDGEIYVANSNPSVVGIMGQYPSAVMITGLSYGTSTITLLLDNGVKDSIDVIVKPDPVSSLTLEVPKTELKVGDSTFLRISVIPSEYYSNVNIVILEGENCIQIDQNTIIAKKTGTAMIQAECDGIYSNIVELSIFDFSISMSNPYVLIGDNEKINLVDYIGEEKTNLNWQIENQEIISLEHSPLGDLYVNGLKEGETSFYLYDDDGHISNTLLVEVVGSNPYLNVSKEEFYADYSRSTSYQDAMYRTECNFMSGWIEVPEQEPTIATYQPEKDGKLIHNSDLDYSNMGNTYTVADSYGNKAFDIYYGAAYTSLEEVAAYIYAWGDVPINYVDDKDESPIYSPWGEYLRLNNSEFYGDTSSYPYEPELPDIAGCDGNLVYYEIDIGTTGTDCDPRYPNRIYNDGYEITRGAARIVYSRYYADTLEPVRPEDRYVFYTYNHYNDFQEYLNYENGWGEMFGNITGGGEISSMNPSECNPTPYVETIREDFN